MLLTYKENVHSTQMYIPLKPLFSRHKGIGVQFTDEPTGNLDEENTRYVMDLVEMLNAKLKVTIVMVSHDITMIKRMDTVFEIKNKKLRRTDYYD